MTPSLLGRTVSSLVASYPLQRGRTRLQTITSPWLVCQLPFGSWARVSGLVEAEWGFFRNTYPDGIAKTLRSLIHPGDVFVDVGANVGYYTMLACSLGAHVTAFEPTPNVFQRLQENLELNGFRAGLHNVAVMDKPGMLAFYISPDDPEANNLFGEGSNGLRVAAFQLDGCVPHADVLKIDAEGAEPFVLDGAHSLLTKCHPKILIEVNPHTLKASGFTPQDIFDRLASHGYEYHIINSTPYKGEIVWDVLAS